MNRRLFPLAATLAVALLLAQHAGSAPNVKTVDGAGLRKAVAAHKGKVVLVNLWATWCAPCVAEFPDIVRLQNAYKARGLQVLAVTIDEPEDRAKVVSFMGRQKAPFPAFIRGKGAIEAFVRPIDKAWGGAVPTTYVFNKSGKLVGAPHVGSMSYQEFEAVVKPLL